MTAEVTEDNLTNSKPPFLWQVESWVCPNCNRPTIELVQLKSEPAVMSTTWTEILRLRAYPKATQRKPVPPGVPSEIGEDYVEACLVLADSPKASAALSRRCLQALLREAAQVKSADLSKEIQEALDRGNMPTYLTNAVDAVRQIGNSQPTQ